MLATLWIGVMVGVFLLAGVVTVWYLRKAETDPRFCGSGLLVMSGVATILLGVYTAVGVFRR